MRSSRTERSFGNFLVREGHITGEQLTESLSKGADNVKPLTEVLVELNLLDQETLTHALSKHHGMPYLPLADYDIDPTIIETVPEDDARKYKMIPVDRTDKTLTVALSDPGNILVLDELKLKTGMDIEPLLSLPRDIEQAIEKYYRKDTGDFDETMRLATEDVDMDVIPDVSDEEFDESDAEAAPVIRLANAIIAQGIEMRASDIHIEPQERNVRLRYRLDGVLQEKKPLPKQMQNALISRLKIMSTLDISEKRRPQDGRFKAKHNGSTVDFRVSMLPTVWGEKIVLRLLDKGNLSLDLTKLGFEQESMEKFHRAIRRPYGIILVTGPTGSGKSTTLYSALSTINEPETNITTVEDPVEFQIQGINQVQAHQEIGFTFAEALRSILRQDPDVVMIGEIRDRETAEIAIKAALTGHLVLSTIHTNDAPSTPTRLIDMDVEPFLVTSALILVVAQRLCRKICVECKEPYRPDPDSIRQLGIEASLVQKMGLKEIVFYKGAGCAKCNGTGYKGRVALYEVMEMDDYISAAIIKGMTPNDLKKLARQRGMLSLRDSGVRKVLQGISTVKEVISVTFEN